MATTQQFIKRGICPFLINFMVFSYGMEIVGVARLLQRRRLQ